MSRTAFDVEDMVIAREITLHEATIEAAYFDDGNNDPEIGANRRKPKKDEEAEKPEE